MKKIKKAFLCLLIGTLTIGAIACMGGCKNTNFSENNEESEIKANLSINKTRLKMKIGDVNKIAVTYNEIPEAKFEWSSLDDNIATVDDKGNVSAHRIGTTTVKVKYAGEEKTCEIIIDKTDELPILDFIDISKDESELNLTVGDSYTIKPIVSYNGFEFNDVVITYEIGNEDIISIEKNIITSKQIGTTNIHIKAEWRDFDSILLERDFTVNVKDVVTILVDEGETSYVELYTVNTFEGNTYAVEKESNVEIITTGAPLDYTVKSLNEDIALAEKTANGLKITQKAHGQTEVVVSVVKNDVEYTSKIKVEVVRPVAKYTETLMFDIVDGEFTKNIFGETIIEKAEETKIVDGNEIIREVKVVDGKLADVELDKNNMKRKFTLTNSKFGYVVDAEVYTKVINDKEDFLHFIPEKEGQMYDGYYVMTNNIDATGLQVINDTFGIDHNDYKKAHKFTGVFDGRGHTVSNLTVDNDGLFGTVTTGALIKNFGMTKVQFPKKGESNSAYNTVFCGTIQAKEKARPAVLSNIYIQVDEIPIDRSWGGRCVIFGNYMQNAKLNNVVIEWPEEKGIVNKFPNGKDAVYERIGGINLLDEDEWSHNELNNIYFISPTSLGVYTNGSVYVYYGENESYMTNPSTGVEDKAYTEAEIKKLYDGIAVNKQGETRECIVSKIVGVKKYNTVEEFNTAKNDYSTFDNKYWNIENGVLSWKNI